MKHITNKQKYIIRKKTRKEIKRRQQENKKTVCIKSGNNKDTCILEMNTDLVKRILEKNGFVSHRESLFKWNYYSYADDRRIITIPEVFSISEDSDSVIGFLHFFYDIFTDVNIKRIEINHKTCKNLGLSASTFMDVVYFAAQKAREERIESLGKFNENVSRELVVRGVMYSDSEIAKILTASGLPKHINVPITGDSPDVNGVEPLDVISGESEQGYRVSAKVSTDLTKYFDKCLKKEGLQLSPEGRTHFTNLFAEVVTNCETHGGKMGTWYTQGVYLKHDNDGELQLMFMNIGDSIYERLSKNCSEETQNRLDLLLEKHKNFFSSKWTKEMLFTLFSLQDGISRFRDKSINGHEVRGNGTVTMIETFQALGAKDANNIPKMTIVSGRTRIIFDEKYKLKDMLFDDAIMGYGNKKRKVIAFNEENDIYSPPDENNVMLCKYKFPGTVISLRFTLNKKYVRSVKERRKDE